jgi:hypothetical protein
MKKKTREKARAKKAKAKGRARSHERIPFGGSPLMSETERQAMEFAAQARVRNALANPVRYHEHVWQPVEREVTMRDGSQTVLVWHECLSCPATKFRRMDVL